MLIGASFAINLKPLGRRMTCSTSIRDFAVLFAFVTSEGSIRLNPRFAGGATAEADLELLQHPRWSAL